MVRLSLWYMFRSFINGIRKSWKALLFILIIILIIIGIITIFPDKKSATDPSTENPTSVSEENIDKTLNLVETDDGIILYENGEAHDISNLIAETVSSLIILLLILLAVLAGAKNGVNIFTMSDVNFLFSSPNKPQAVLLFKMISQIGSAVAFSIYLIYQMPNLISHGLLTVTGAVILIFAFILFNIVCKLISVFTYTCLQKHPYVKAFLSKYVLLFTGLPIVIVLSMIFVFKLGIYNSINAVFGTGISRAIPFWGWFKAAAAYIFSEDYLLAAVYILITILGTAAIVFFTWKTPVDYYEDALTSATEQSIMQANMEAQAAGGMSANVRHEGKHGEKKWEKRRSRALSFDGYEGAKAFFGRIMLLRKRMYTFGLFSPTASTYLWLSIGIAFSMSFLMEVTEALPILITFTGLTVVFMFFRSFMNPLGEDLALNFIYMVPEKPTATLLWGMMGQFLDGAIDLIPASIIIGAATKSPLYTLGCYFVLLTMHIFFGTTALVVNLVAKNYLPIYISNLLQIIVRILPIFLLWLIYTLGSPLLDTGIILITIIAVNVISSVLAFLPCPYNLHRGRR